jgi:hypothetical protein
MGQQPEQQEQQQPHGHPYGVQPWGNFYLTGVPEIRTAGGQLAQHATKQEASAARRLSPPFFQPLNCS